MYGIKGIEGGMFDSPHFQDELREFQKETIDSGKTKEC